MLFHLFLLKSFSFFFLKIPKFELTIPKKGLSEIVTTVMNDRVSWPERVKSMVLTAIERYDDDDDDEIIYLNLIYPKIQSFQKSWMSEPYRTLEACSIEWASSSKVIDYLIFWIWPTSCCSTKNISTFRLEKAFGISDGLFKSTSFSERKSFVELDVTIKFFYQSRNMKQPKIYNPTYRSRN